MPSPWSLEKMDKVLNGESPPDDTAVAGTNMEVADDFEKTL